MSSGSLMPSRCRGSSSGSSSHTHRTMVPRFSFSSAPPMPNPSKPSGSRSRAACRRRSSYCAPCTTPNSAWYGLPARSAVSRRCSSMQRAAHAWVRSTDRSWYSRVFIRVVHSSNAKMMSAPSWCWIRIEISGVNRCIEPSRCDLNVTPSSSTVASRFLPAAMTSSDCRPAAFIASTFLNPTPERHHLEAAGIGERRAGPVHERAETAGLVDDVRSGLQVQVVGVGQHRLRAQLGDRLRAAATFTVALVPTAMNAGVPDGAVRRADDAGAPLAAGQPRADLEPEP